MKSQHRNRLKQKSIANPILSSYSPRRGNNQATVPQMNHDLMQINKQANLRTDLNKINDSYYEANISVRASRKSRRNCLPASKDVNIP